MTIENAKSLEILHRHSLREEGVTLKDYVQQRAVIETKFQQFEELIEAYFRRHNLERE
ncbi:hypothetical protein [Lignipirellula cremea]|uniref:Uncharacterized protein n=1 Tax=Lignipirellula cremea TaxID=2528010 RepID=A0A518DWJ5_9BACT|nr:hypothetical protein [Lignipirellula cremea]QDU96210.1 hypothetical protein Pla8534_40290 [Lignipirellula cremea]